VGRGGHSLCHEAAGRKGSHAARHSTFQERVGGCRGRRVQCVPANEEGGKRLASSNAKALLYISTTTRCMPHSDQSTLRPRAACEGIHPHHITSTTLFRAACSARLTRRSSSRKCSGCNTPCIIMAATSGDLSPACVAAVDARTENTLHLLAVPLRHKHRPLHVVLVDWHAVQRPVTFTPLLACRVQGDVGVASPPVLTCLAKPASRLCRQIRCKEPVRAQTPLQRTAVSAVPAPLGANVQGRSHRQPRGHRVLRDPYCSTHPRTGSLSSATFGYPHLWDVLPRPGWQADSWTRKLRIPGQFHEMAV
jgi:hypothetical protein